MDDGTVILTTLNEAWAASDSIIDLFLESFRIGNQTHRLLKHLVIITLDRKAYIRCLALHTHCFALTIEGLDFSKKAYFMTPDYLKMMWRRIDFLRSVLEMGYNFVFTDADVMWFRDPFLRFYLDADFQIACDHFMGDSFDLNNKPNGGFNYVKSNNRTIAFYKYWYSSRETHPGYHDQDVLNMIKFDPFITEIGLTMRFLNTAYFGGLCEPSKSLNQVCTMHANCCYGMDSKLHDLRIMLEDWRKFMTLPPSVKRASLSSWRIPQNCRCNIPQAANCISRVAERANTPVIYLSTDAAESETDLLQSLTMLNGRTIPLVKRPARNSTEKWDALLYRHGLEGDSQVEAMLDKTISAMSTVFIGASGSTFTEDILRL